MVSELVISEIQEAAQAILARYGEPAAISVAISWKVGQAEFPFGTIVTREGDDPLNPKLIGSVSEQLQKLVSFVNGKFVSQVFQKQLEDLRRQLREKDEELKKATEASGPPPAGGS
jgi:hypothetical protein